MEPLYQWIDIIPQKAGSFFEEILESLDSGNPIQGKIFESLPNKNRLELISVCKELNRIEYHKKQGEHIETRNDEEKRQLKTMNDQLNKLAECLSYCINKVIRRVADQEQIRIYNTIKALSKSFISESWNQAKSIAPKLGFGAPNDIDLDMIQDDYEFDYKFEAGFDLKTVIKNDRIGTRKEADGTVKKYVGSERLWYTLWLVKKDIYRDETRYKDVPVYEKRAYDLAHIPNSEELLVNWSQQLFRNEKVVVESFTEWLSNQINCLQSIVESSQAEFVSNYQNKLDEANEHAKVGHQIEMEKLESILQSTNEMESKLKSLIISA